MCGLWHRFSKRFSKFQERQRHRYLTRRTHNGNPKKQQCTIPKFSDSPPIKQIFAFPPDMIKYMTMKPSSAKGWNKLIRTCKYFYAKNPLNVVKSLRYTDENQWKAAVFHGNSCYHYWMISDFSKIKYQIWISKSLEISSLTSNLASSVISKLYPQELCNIHFKNQIISFNEFQIIAACNKLKTLEFRNVKIFDGGKNVPFETIIKNLSNVRHLTFEFGQNNVGTITFETAENLVETLKTTNKCRFFQLIEIPETFNFQPFFEFILDHIEITWILEFSGNISTEYKKRVQNSVDNLFHAIRLNVTILLPGQPRATFWNKISEYKSPTFTNERYTYRNSMDNEIPSTILLPRISLQPPIFPRSHQQQRHEKPGSAEWLRNPFNNPYVIQQMMNPGLMLQRYPTP
uniref:Uncharacterized protein n=1 Tax=Panagrolaimus sp. PS1159 TaxID=55785 RepID=A0AC35EVN1_9BILA